ncbi:MAG: hypothetical protein ACYDB3_02080 [Acidimicrobiales bacterium]
MKPLTKIASVRLVVASAVLGLAPLAATLVAPSAPAGAATPTAPARAASSSSSPSQLCAVFQGLASGAYEVETGWNSQAGSNSGAPTFTLGASGGPFPDFAGQIASGANSSPLGCTINEATPPSSPQAVLCAVFQGVVSGLEAVEQGWDSGSGQSSFTGSNDIGGQIASGANSNLGCNPPITTTPASSPAPTPSPPSGGGGGPSSLCPAFAALASGLETLESGWNGGAPAGAPTFAQGSAAGSFPDFAGQIASGANSNLGCKPPITVSYPAAKASPTLAVAAPASDAAGSAIDPGSITATLAKSSGSSDTTTITFTVFGPSATAPSTCTSGGTTVGTAKAAGDGTYSPGQGFTPTQTGDYWWYASAPADANDASAVSPCPPTVETVVSPPTKSGSSCRVPAGATGYWQVASDGGIFAFGNLPYCGSMGGTVLNQPVVGMAGTPDAGGYWLVASDGGVFAFGDAAFQGSMGGTPLNKPVVGMALDPATGGYWLVASDGGIFAFGAPYYGSMGGTPLDKPVVGMASTPDGRGYWLVASDGGVFAFGDAAFHGSMGGTTLDKPVTGVAADPATGGYWLVASDGGVFAFDAPYYGSMGGTSLNRSVVGMASPDAGGYWLVAADGGLFSFGDAQFHGSMGGQPLNKPVVGMAD